MIGEQRAVAAHLASHLASSSGHHGWNALGLPSRAEAVRVIMQVDTILGPKAGAKGRDCVRFPSRAKHLCSAESGPARQFFLAVSHRVGPPSPDFPPDFTVLLAFCNSLRCCRRCERPSKNPNSPDPRG